MDAIREQLQALKASARERAERSKKLHLSNISYTDKASSSVIMQSSEPQFHTSSGYHGSIEIKKLSSPTHSSQLLQKSSVKEEQNNQQQDQQQKQSTTIHQQQLKYQKPAAVFPKNSNPPPSRKEQKLKTWRSESEMSKPAGPQALIKRLVPPQKRPLEKRKKEEEESPLNKNHHHRHEIVERAQSSPALSDVRTLRIKDKKYMVLSEIGRGGTSKVYQAVSESLKRCVAIKVVNLSNAELMVRDAYENEIGLLEQLQGSPHVIRMFDYEKRNNEFFVVMECGDTDLATFMRKNSKEIDDKIIKYYWHEMLKCVQVIHDKNIVHSDLKPANFLLVGGRLKLIDFGIASNIPSNKTSVLKEMQVGTLNYMGPEAITGSYMDDRGFAVSKIPLKSDVWSLGCILYGLVYGRTPFHDIVNPYSKIRAITSEEHILEFPRTGKTRDRLLIDVLKKCLVRDVKQRASIQQLLHHPYLHDTSLNATPSPARLRHTQMKEEQPVVSLAAPAKQKSNAAATPMIVPNPARHKENGRVAGGLRVIK